VMCVSPRYDNFEGAVPCGERVTYSVCGEDTDVSYYHKYDQGVDYVFVDHECYHSVADSIY